MLAHKTLINLFGSRFISGIKTPQIEIILGHFLSHLSVCHWQIASPGQQRYAKVIKTEEKGSDVNLATHLLHDGYQGA